MPTWVPMWASHSAPWLVWALVHQLVSMSVLECYIHLTVSKCRSRSPYSSYNRYHLCMEGIAGRHSQHPSRPRLLLHRDMQQESVEQLAYLSANLLVQQLEHRKA